ncbi:MAG: hypothetical protein ACRDHJ_03775 [Actinomycetota bacterium]
MSGKNVKPGREKFDAPTTKPTIAPDGAPVQDAKVEIHPGQVTRLEPKAAPDVRAGTKPAPEGPTNDEAFRG